MQISSGGSGNNSIFDVNKVNDDPTINVNSVNAEASKLLMKAADEKPADSTDDPDDPNDPANIAQQEQKLYQEQLDNRAAENDITTGTNTGVSTSPNNQAIQVASAAQGGLRDSFAGGQNAQTTALASIQSSSLDRPTTARADLESVSIRSFDHTQRV